VEDVATEKLFSYVEFVQTNCADFCRVLTHIDSLQLPDFESQIHALENRGYQFDGLRDTYDQVSDPEQRQMVREQKFSQVVRLYRDFDNKKYQFQDSNDKKFPVIIFAIEPWTNFYFLAIMKIPIMKVTKCMAHSTIIIRSSY
jgi:hypothetical protein